MYDDFLGHIRDSGVWDVQDKAPVILPKPNEDPTVDFDGVIWGRWKRFVWTVNRVRRLFERRER